MVGTYKSPIAKYGRNGDTMVAHVTKGEQIVPKQILDKNPDLVMHIAHAIRNAGANPDQYKVGKNMSINPATGHPEFGLFFGSGGIFGGHGGFLGNPVTRTASEIAASFIPGVGPLVSAGIGATAGATGAGQPGHGTIGGTITGGISGYGIGVGTQAISGAIGSAVGASGANLAAGASGPVTSGLGTAQVAGNALYDTAIAGASSASKLLQAGQLASQIMGQKAPSQGGAPGITTPPPYVPKQPAAMAMPGSLSYMAGYTPDQVRSSLATQGVNGGLSGDQQSYYTNLLQRSLIGSNNQVTAPSNSSFLSPIESQYFSQKGINTSSPTQFLAGIS